IIAPAFRRFAGAEVQEAPQHGKGLVLSENAHLRHIAEFDDEILRPLPDPLPEFLNLGFGLSLVTPLREVDADLLPPECLPERQLRAWIQREQDIAEPFPKQALFLHMLCP